MSSLFVPVETASFNLLSINEDEIAKSQHAFIAGNNLVQRWQSLSAESKRSFIIAETKFGSGLNLLLSWSLWLQNAPQNAQLHYICYDSQPFKYRDLKKIWSLWPQFAREAGLLLADYPILTPGFHHLSFDDGRINVTLMLGDMSYCFNQLLLCSDAFVEKNLRTNFVDAWLVHESGAGHPNPISTQLCETFAMLSRPGSTLISTLPGGLIAKNLQAVGFAVREDGDGIIKAAFIEHGKYYRTRFTPWHVCPAQQTPLKTVIVLGAGLAGCFSAYALAKRGFKIILLDRYDEVGLGASGNIQAVLYPKLSAYNSPLTSFMLSAYLYANRFYLKLLKTQQIGELSGLLQLAHNKKEDSAQFAMREWLQANPALGKLVNAEEASILAGIPLHKGGLYLPLSGWMDCQAICQYLVQFPGIQWMGRKSINELVYKNGLWTLGEHQAETLILANGYEANQFSQTLHIPLKSISGQLTQIASNIASKKLKIPLCSTGHVLPESNMRHVIGATFHQHSLHQTPSRSDDLDNIAKLKLLPGHAIWSDDIVNNWCGVRAATPDYLPLVGPVPDEHAFYQRFLPLANNSKRWLPVPGEYYPGLYLCAGFGSRGLTTIPLAAEWLASLINNEPAIIPQRLVQALSPARFLIKKIVKERA